MKNIRDFSVSDKRILVRCDFNVGFDEQGNIVEDSRMQKTLLTIQYLIEKRAKVILISHLGNPKGIKVGDLTLDKVRRRLEELLRISVKKADDCVGSDVKKEVLDLESGRVFLLENLRFHKEEDENDEQFAKELAQLGDIYINEAFSESHRSCASIIGIPKYLPSGVGFLFEEEINHLDKILKNPEKPLVILIGGKKVKDKAGYAEKLLKLADWVLIGGPVKKELQKQHSDILQDVNLFGPENNLEALDIDSKTIDLFKEKILQSKTIFWNGPFGKFEDEQYKKGTLEIAKAIIESGAFSVVGGGDTVEFLNKEGIMDKFSWISSGGGAMLAYISGERMPGLEALNN